MPSRDEEVKLLRSEVAELRELIGRQRFPGPVVDPAP